MHNAIQNLIQVMQASLAELPKDELAAHEGRGMYQYIPHHEEAFCKTLEFVAGFPGLTGYHFVDVGCGIGAKLVLACDVLGHFFISSRDKLEITGVEFNHKYVEVARSLVSRDNRNYFAAGRVAKDIQVVECDGREHDYKPYDIIYSYCPMQDSSLQRELEEQIYKTAHKGAVIFAVGAQHIRSCKMDYLKKYKIKPFPWRRGSYPSEGLYIKG